MTASKKLFLLFLSLILPLLMFSSCMEFLNINSDGSDSDDEAKTPKSEYTVTLDTQGGTALKPMVVKAGAKCYTPYSTIKFGYEFDCWYYNGEPWDFSKDTVNEDITLVANWKIINYNITYDLNGGSYDGEMPQSYNVNSSTISFGTPVREDYEFLGWEINGKKTNEIKADSAKDMTVVATWFGIEAEVMSAKGGAGGIVSIIHDDARLPTMAILDSMLEKYGLVADVGFILNKVYANGVVNTAELENFRVYIDNGRWKIVNHSATHTWWGEQVSSTTGVSYAVDNMDRLTYEVVTSQEKMRELFPGQRVLTFALPGFSTEKNKYTDGSLYQLKQIIYSPTARQLINDNYIGSRYYSGGSNSLSGDIDWGWINTRFLSAGSISNNLDSILENAASTGQLEVLSIHGLTTDPEQNAKDPSYYLMDTSMDLALSKVNKYVDEGRLWNANFEDAILYVREAQTAKIAIQKGDNMITLTLTDDMPNEIYNTPLTVRVKNFGSWEAAKIVQGDTVQYATAKTADEETYLQFDALPDSDEIIITPVAIDEIPE